MAELEKPASIIPKQAESQPRPALPGEVPGNEDGNPTTAPVRTKKGLNWKVLFIGGAVVFVLVALAVATFLGNKGGNFGGGRPEPLVPTPTTVPTPVVPEFDLGEPTVYSNDPQVLQLEGALKNFERQLDEVDFREQELDPPVLLMEVNFILPRN